MKNEKIEHTCLSDYECFTCRPFLHFKFIILNFKFKNENLTALGSGVRLVWLEIKYGY